MSTGGISPQLPILLFPTAANTPRQKLKAGFPQLPKHFPSRQEQAARLDAKFQSINPQLLHIQPQTAGVDPEEVIVLETAVDLASFQQAVQSIPGMEWLGDFSIEIAQPDPGFLVDGTGSAATPGRLFVIASNKAAYDSLLSLWNTWKGPAPAKLGRGFTPLEKVFQYLNDVRPWGVSDRVRATGVVAYWEKSIQTNVDSILFEVDLWFRIQAGKRDSTYRNFQSIVSRVGGECLRHVVIAEIGYDGVLLKIPPDQIRKMLSALENNQQEPLLQFNGVKCFAPMGQTTIMPSKPSAAASLPQKPLPQGYPVAALFDGLPLSQHAALRDRLAIDDPDGYSQQYQANEQRHGTAMASLIIHGDAGANEASIKSKLYVRPVMVPQGANNGAVRDESFLTTELTVDLVHRAVRRLYVKEGGAAAKGPDIRVINLSVGNRLQLFDNELSPWARLLDWLSWKFKVLFIVSAGNHLDDIVIPVTAAHLPTLTDAEFQRHTLHAMWNQKVERRLLAPSESINALTVGALHSQSSSTQGHGSLVDMLRGAAFPSPINPVASGFGRSVKPDLLVPGGIQHYDVIKLGGPSNSTTLGPSSANKQPGQLTAAPGGQAVPPSQFVSSCGTSNAAALTTRQAIRFLETLQEWNAAPDRKAVDSQYWPLIVKAMLIHGAGWGDLENQISQLFEEGDAGQKRRHRLKRLCTQFLGHGPADFARGTVCTDQRVIALGFGQLAAEGAHLYRFPLPQALNAVKVKKKLTLTLTWFSPIDPGHRDYAMADLWFDPPKKLLAKRLDITHTAVRRGTVQHEILEGAQAVPITEDDVLDIQVNCMPRAGGGTLPPIDYALLVSLEVAEPLSASIYNQVKTKLDQIAARVPIRPQ